MGVFDSEVVWGFVLVWGFVWVLQILVGGRSRGMQASGLFGCF